MNFWSRTKNGKRAIAGSIGRLKRRKGRPLGQPFSLLTKSAKALLLRFGTRENQPFNL